jgi:hypothetical protein
LLEKRLGGYRYSWIKVEEHVVASVGVHKLAILLALHQIKNFKLVQTE